MAAEPAIPHIVDPCLIRRDPLPAAPAIHLPVRAMQSPPLLYTRDLPGGGFVAIDAHPADAGHSVRLWVERRGDPSRRMGHLPPVIVERSASDVDSALAELRPIASDNLALAQAIRRWQKERSL